jgi:hypothetical protein
MDKMVYSRATIDDNPGSLLMSIGVMIRAHASPIQTCIHPHQPWPSQPWLKSWA